MHVSATSTLKIDVNDWRVRILLLEMPYPTAPHLWDRQAIRAMIEVDSPSFHVHLPTMIWTHELAALHTLLHSLHQRVGQEICVSFEFREGALLLTYEMKHSGAIDLQVHVRGMELDGEPTLAFSLAVDQSYLPQWISDLHDALSFFPEQESPTEETL